ncbi:c-type cytochrome [Cytobacillus gottheilii]|uniref:c-type cytochrome n=1 Tax=Cytobacillus gottheilii TaxID=859144 RepID=UPI003CFB8F3D
MKKFAVTSGINIVLIGLLVFLLFFYNGVPSSEVASTEEAHSGHTDTSSVNAEEIVNQSCISCHGQTLEGGAGPALNDVGSRLDQVAIEDIIVNGKNGMPGGLISAEESAAVAEWLAQKQ